MRRSPSKPRRRRGQTRCATGGRYPRARRKLPRCAGWSSPPASAISPEPDPPRRDRASAPTPAMPHAAPRSPHRRFARHAPPPRITAKTESHPRFVGQAGRTCLVGRGATARRLCLTWRSKNANMFVIYIIAPKVGDPWRGTASGAGVRPGGWATGSDTPHAAVGWRIVDRRIGSVRQGRIGGEPSQHHARVERPPSRRARLIGDAALLVAQWFALGPVNGLFLERAAPAHGIKLNLSMDNGRIAMSTRNVLRARALAGQRVVW